MLKWQNAAESYTKSFGQKQGALKSLSISRQNLTQTTPSAMAVFCWNHCSGVDLKTGTASPTTHHHHAPSTPQRNRAAHQNGCDLEGVKGETPQHTLKSCLTTFGKRQPGNTGKTRQTDGQDTVVTKISQMWINTLSIITLMAT